LRNGRSDGSCGNPRCLFSFFLLPQGKHGRCGPACGSSCIQCRVFARLLRSRGRCGPPVCSCSTQRACLNESGFTIGAGSGDVAVFVAVEALHVFLTALLPSLLALAFFASGTVFPSFLFVSFGTRSSLSLLSPLSSLSLLSGRSLRSSLGLSSLGLLSLCGSWHSLAKCPLLPQLKQVLPRVVVSFSAWKM